MYLNRLVPEAKDKNMLLLCNNAGNVHNVFAPFTAKLHKPFGVHIYKGLILFSHVHLAEFNFLLFPWLLSSS